MKKSSKQVSSDAKPAQIQPSALSATERKRLLAALETARENAKPRVRSLLESEALSNELLNLRLKAANDQREYSVPSTDD